jgi:hypothetical protein
MSAFLDFLRRLLEGLRARPKTTAAVAGTAVMGFAALTLNVGTPSGGGACEAPTCFPDASNTGVTNEGALTTVSGLITISSDDSVYEDKIVNGCVRVTGENVTIRNVRVVITPAGGGNCEAWGICFADQSACDTPSSAADAGLIVEDTEVDCQGIDDEVAGRTAITVRNYIATRVDVYGGCENALWCEQDCTIEDSYVHEIVPCDIGPLYDCGHSEEDPPHTDGIQGSEGADNITIRHNTVYGHYQEQDDPGTPGVDEGRFGNAAINVAGGIGSAGATNMTYEDNLLAGGGYTLYCPGNTSATNTFTGNRFSTIFTAEDPNADVSDVGGFGPTYPSCDDEPNFDATNVFHDGPNEGDPVL